MELSSPLAFLLALGLGIPLTVAAYRRSAVGLPGWRWRLGLGLRLLLLLGLALVIGGATAVVTHERRAWLFLVDVSESVPPAARSHAFDWVRQAAQARRPGDQVALVTFAGRARLERVLSLDGLPAEDPRLDGLNREQTRLSTALRLAAGLVGGLEGADPRVVVISDGNTPLEAALQDARALAALDVPLDTVALELTPSPREVLISDVEAPVVVALDEPFLLKVEVQAVSEGQATLQLIRDGGLSETRAVTLAPGSNRFAFSQKLARAGTASYTVSLSASGDANVANNVGGALVRVRGPPEVVVVQGATVDALGRQVPPEEVAQPLVAALERAGFLVQLEGPGGLGAALDGLSNRAALVIGSFGAERWSQRQLERVRRYVADEGGGLLALGGPESFGLGGYYQTPLEEALPISADVRDKKVLPSLGLVFLIDKSGSMIAPAGPPDLSGGGPGSAVGGLLGAGLTQLELAKEGAVRSLSLLQPFDQLGVVAFADSPEWVLPLRPVRRGGDAEQRIRQIEVAGGTLLAPAVRSGLERLLDVETQLKHLVLLTDGKSEPRDQRDLNELVGELRRSGVTLTTVGIGDGIDETELRRLAEQAGGRFLWAREPRTIPRLLTKEAVTASRALVVERPIQVRVVNDPGDGVDYAQAPPLLGFTMTAAKPEAEVLLDTGPDDSAEDGPILVRWRYGLGRSAAFTSDASARWTRQWLSWPGWRPAVSRLARWVARQADAPGLETSLELDGVSGRVEVEASGRDGRPLTGLSLVARVSPPRDAALPPPLDLVQERPGRYVGRFPASQAGPWRVTVARQDEGGGQAVVGGVSDVLAYPREFEDLTAQPELLARLSAVTGGRALSLDDSPQVLLDAPASRRQSRGPLDGWLLLLAGLLLLADVAARRLVIPESWRRPAQRQTGQARPQLLSRLQEEKEAKRDALAAARRAASERLAAAASARVAGGSERATTQAPPAQTSLESRPQPRPPARPQHRPPARPPAPGPRPKTSQPAPADDGTSMGKLLQAKRRARGARGGAAPSSESEEDDA